MLPFAEALNKPRQPSRQLRIAPSRRDSLSGQEVLKAVDEVLNWVVLEAAFAKVHPGASNEWDRTVGAQYRLKNWNYSSNFGPVSVRKANRPTCVPKVGEEQVLDDLDEVLIRVPAMTGGANLDSQNALRDDREQLQGGLRNRWAVRYLGNQMTCEPLAEAREGLVTGGHGWLQEPPCAFLYGQFQRDP
ncbi:MAG: hypothetical protein MZV65_30230 [Chromatiales bacterium]|nr:hypothetical protein [Chromatiales bacterium]